MKEGFEEDFFGNTDGADDSLTLFLPCHRKGKDRYEKNAKVRSFTKNG